MRMFGAIAHFQAHFKNQLFGYLAALGCGSIFLFGITRGEVARPRSGGPVPCARCARMHAGSVRSPAPEKFQHPISNIQHPSNKGRGRATALRGFPIPCARCARMHAGSVRSPALRSAFNHQYPIFRPWTRKGRRTSRPPASGYWLLITVN